MVRPFSRQTCGKSFSRKNGLKTYMIRTSHLLVYNDVITAAESKETQGGTVEQVLASHHLIAAALVSQDTGMSSPPIEAVAGTADETNEQPAELMASSETFELPKATAHNMTESQSPVMQVSVASAEVRPTEANSNITEVRPSEDHSYNSEIVCSACSEVFPGKDELWTHFQCHLPENAKACAKCFQTFNSEEILVEHQKICHEESAVVAGNIHINAGRNDGEEQALAPKAEKKKRQGAIVSDKPEQSSICDKVFGDITSLKRRAFVHSGERQGIRDEEEVLEVVEMAHSGNFLMGFTM